MKDEITAAVAFLVRLIAKSDSLSNDKTTEFREKLTGILTSKFENHWFPEKPSKGQGYRCIRVNENDRRDPTIELTCKLVGVKYDDLRLPIELTLWVDPEEVTCRFGEHKGSYCIVATFKDGNKENFIDKINIDELEKKSLERSKKASFELVNSSKKRKNWYQKNNYQNGDYNGLYSGIDYSIPISTVTSSPFGYSPLTLYYSGSPKYGPHYGGSPSQQHSVQTPTHSQNMFSASYSTISPPLRSSGGTPFRGPNGFGTTSGSSPVIGSGSTPKFARGLHTAFNNAALALTGTYQHSDRYHWMNKSIVKA